MSCQSNKKAVIFDLDGTILDTSEGIKHSVSYTVRTLLHCDITENDVSKFVGPPIQESLMKYFGLNEMKAQQGADIFRTFYKNNALYEAKPYDNIIDLFKGLKKNNIKIAVATYKREDYAIQLLHYFGISPFCDTIHGADNNNILRKSDIIKLCCKEMQLSTPEVYLAGDTEHDAQGAFQLDMPFIAVTWGFGYTPQNTDTKYAIHAVAHSPLDILSIINN